MVPTYYSLVCVIIDFLKQLKIVLKDKENRVIFPSRECYKSASSSIPWAHFRAKGTADPSESWAHTHQGNADGSCQP